MLPHRELLLFSDFAVHLARLGGDMALHWVGSRAPEMKADDSPVTQADHAVQAAILESIGSRYSHHGVLVEETLAQPERHETRQADFCWVIDPIDGTRNFARGSRTFAVSVALLHEGWPVAAAMYDARSRSVYHAARGHGCFLDDKAVRVKNAPLDSRAIVAISSLRGKPVPDSVRRLFDIVLFRNLGSLCLHMASVAGGDFDGLYSHEAKAWDIAAGCLLVEEAGGRATAPDGRPLWPLNTAEYEGTDIPTLAAGPQMHDALVKHLTGR